MQLPNTAVGRQHWNVPMNWLQIASKIASRKLIVGPVAATALLTSGDISSWQWVAVTLGYVAIQGAIDAVEKKLRGPVRDEQDADTPKPE